MDNLNQLRQKIELFLDNALDQKDQDSIQEILNNNPFINQIVQSECSFREFVKSNITRPKVSNDFINQIKSNIPQNGQNLSD